MLERVIRIMLAIATAVVLTAQVEAAAQHCARLAHVSLEPVRAETPSCHDMKQAGGAPHRGPAQKAPVQDRCECIAVLSESAAIVTAAGSGRIEPYAWTPTPAASFASTEPAPDLRPPRT